MQACNDLRVEWTALRNALADARREAEFFSVQEFAQKIGVDKGTVYRIEKHEVEPELSTIEAWLRETNRQSVGAFLSQFDGSAQKKPAGTQPVTPLDTLRLVSSESHGEAPGEPSDVRATFVSDLSAAEARLLQRFGLVVAGAASAVLAAREDEQAARNESDSRKTGA